MVYVQQITTRKKPFDVIYLSIQNVAISLVAMRNKKNKKITEHQLDFIKCNKTLEFYLQFRTECLDTIEYNQQSPPLKKL